MKNINYNDAFSNVSDITSLIRVFESYGNVFNKVGRGYTTKCEFHNDKNPSMAVYEYQGTGFYKCMSCGTTGNIVSYIKEKEGCNGYHALEIIYDRLSLDISPYITHEELSEEEKQKRLEEAKKKLEEDKIRNKHLALLHKTSDKKFLIGVNDVTTKCDELIEEIKKGSKDYEKVEVINHAMYKVDRTCYIDKYISEDYTGIIEALQLANEGKRVLLISPTGSGKNYTTVKVINECLKYPVALVSPNASNVEQGMKSYNLSGAYGDLSIDEAFKEDSLIKIMTWDKAVKLKDNEKVKDHILLLDEADQVFRDLYREKAIRGFNDVAPLFKGRLDMTGTPTKLDFSEFDYIIEYKQRKQTNYKVKMYDGISQDKMLEIINNSNNFGILYDNKDTLEFLNNNTSKNTEVITSENKKVSKLYKMIMENSSMGDFEGCLNTSVMVASVNINNNNITDIIVAGVKDIGTIKQYVARYRGLEEVRVHIFNNYKEIDGQIYSIEDAIKKECECITEEVTRMNIELLTDEIGYKIDKFNLTPLQSSGEKFYRDAELGVYKANYSNIRGLMYSRYYSSRSAKQFRVLLQEQFKDIDVNIELVETSEKTKNDIKQIRHTKNEEINEALKILEQYKNDLIGIVEYMEGSISDELDKYMTYNKINPFKISVDLEDKGLLECFKHKKVKDQNKIFTKYVVEYGYSVDYAWKISQESKNTRTNIFRAMNLITYRHLKEELPIVINPNLQEVKLYEYIESKVGLAQYYNKESIKALTEDLKAQYNAFNLKEKDVSSILKNMYNIKEVKMNSDKIDEIDDELFLLNIRTEKKHAGKRVGIMKIESYKTINSLKEELAVPNLDYSIEKYINTKIKQCYKALDIDVRRNYVLEDILIYIPNN